MTFKESFNAIVGSFSMKSNNTFCDEMIKNLPKFTSKIADEK